MSSTKATTQRKVRRILKQYMNIVLSVALPPEHYSPEKATVEIEPHSPHQEQGKQVDVGSPPRRSVYAIEKTAPFMG